MGWGIRVCLLRSCFDRPLVFFQRLLGSCAARISRENALVRAQQEALLPLCYLCPVHATSLPACRCINTCSVIDVAAGISIFLSQHYRCDFDGSGIRVVFDS